MRIFHIVDRSIWVEAVGRGEYVPAGFDQDGFVHFSFAAQVARVANAIYRDEPDLIVVEIESDQVPAELRVEDCYEAGEEFPHVYGPIPPAAATRTLPLSRDDNGDWTFSRHAADDRA